MNITISSLRRVPNKFKHTKFDGMISINDPDSQLVPECVARQTLLLYFRDSHPGRRKRGCCVETDMRQIVNFTNELPHDAELLVNCHRGRCRSTAIAIIVLAMQMPVSEAVERVMKAAPKGNPNGWMLHLADRMFSLWTYETCSKLWRVKYQKDEFIDGY